MGIFSFFIAIASNSWLAPDEYLELNPYVVVGKRVLELGCGTGLCGIVAAALVRGDAVARHRDI